MENIYIGTRYVPKIEGLHDVNKEYENFSIVTDINNNSYTSRKNVPIGIPLSNIEYWVQTGKYDGVTPKTYTSTGNNSTVNSVLIDKEQGIFELTLIGHLQSSINYVVSKIIFIYVDDANFSFYKVANDMLFNITDITIDMTIAPSSINANVKRTVSSKIDLTAKVTKIYTM